jgi:hypothetical protein
MEVVIDYETLEGAFNDTIVKELSIAAEGVVQTYYFQSPYPSRPRVSTEKSLNWDDGHIPYEQLHTVVEEAVTGYADLYSYGTSKCKFLSELFGRAFINLETFKCPSPQDFKPRYNCGMSCHKFPNVRCATRSAHALYKWLMYHLQTKSYVKCPKDMRRHTALFVSAV